MPVLLQMNAKLKSPFAGMTVSEMRRGQVKEKSPLLDEVQVCYLPQQVDRQWKKLAKKPPVKPPIATQRHTCVENPAGKSCAKKIVLLVKNQKLT